jgi:rhodanese-related sulfurtransferase
LTGPILLHRGRRRADASTERCAARPTAPAPHAVQPIGARHNGPVSAIDELLARARARLDRVSPDRLAAEVAAGALVVDTRPIDQRERDGALPGAIVVDRNVLEWRLDPSSPHRLPVVTDHDQRIIVVCNEGYSSSLAAATLHELGLHRATDLAGGYQAWLRNREQR